MAENIERRLAALEAAISKQANLEEAVTQNNNSIRDLKSQLTYLDQSVEIALQKLLPKVDALLSEREERYSSANPVQEQTIVEQNTVEHNTVEQNTVEENTVQRNTMERNTEEKNIVEQNTVQQNPDLRNNTQTAVDDPKTDVKSLTSAVEMNNLELLFCLLEAGTDVNERNCFGETALHIAALKGFERAVKVLLGSGAPVDCVTQCGRTALHCAAINGHKQVTLTLLLGGAQVDFKDEDGHTAMLLAANEGHWEVVKLLLNAGAKAEALNTGNSTTPLRKAFEAGEVKIVRMMLELGKNKWSDKQLWETLTFSTSPDVILVVRETLPPSRWCRVGKMALVNSAKSGRKDSIEALLDAGVNINGGDCHNCTPLQWACCFGHVECVRILLDRGAQIFSTDIYGDTPLHEAALRNQDGCIRLLLDVGADKYITNRQDKIPFDLAKTLSTRNLLS